MDHSKDEPQIPPELQKKFNEQMDALWEDYMRHCIEAKISPVSRDTFADTIQEKIMGMIAKNQADKVKDWSSVYVVAAAVKKLKMPVSASAIIDCSQCGQSVWISPQLEGHYKKAKGVICTDCAPEMTGKSMDDLIKDNLI